MNLRIERAAGQTEAERNVAGLIHRDAAHPTIIGIRSVGALLENCWRGTRRPNFVPTNADACPCGHAVVNNQRFMIAEVPIRESVHQTIP